MIPRGAPNGKAIIEQMCPFLAQKLCVGIMIEGGLGDPDAFTQIDHFTERRLCAEKTFVPQSAPSTFDPALSTTQTEGTSTVLQAAEETSSYTTDVALSRLLSAGATSSASTPTTFLTTVYISSKTTSTSKTQKTHMVHLDYGKNTFRPNQVFGEVGDIVQFFFLAPGHTVIETSLDDPCTPSGGFESGPETRSDLVSAGRHFNNTMSFTITMLNPRYFSCGRPGHCQNGMVFAVNANETVFSKFLQNIPSLPKSTLPSQTSIVATQALALNSNNKPIPTICSVCPTPLTSAVPV
ncbi:hypothetical protein TWF718_001555 [Orbilia javanica]|uniref:Phytocyanin domain-containing protein n=1 Tax=Orbilia javanica TaxID=47235 RepID=A0AAN8MVH5_9PEZI